MIAKPGKKWDGNKWDGMEINGNGMRRKWKWK